MSIHGMRRRQHKAHRTRAWHPAAIVGICLAAAIVLTVLVGNLLRRLVDEDTYRKLTEGETEASVPAQPSASRVRAVNAYPFSLENTDGATTRPAASVTLNSPDGTLSYTSDVAAHLSLNENSDVPLHDSLRAISTFAPYISGVFHPQAFDANTSDLLYARALEEGALLREFLNAGGSEIVLCDLPFSATDTDTVCTYLSAVKSAIGASPLGVAVPTSLLSGENWELLARLEQVCDFLLLDLREADIQEDDRNDAGVSPAVTALLNDHAYPLSAFSMRPLVKDTQELFVSTFEATAYPNYQIVAE